MQTEALQTPVALFVFKRPETTRRVFEVISKVQPAKLLLVADGPRRDHDGEAEACQEVRDIVTRIDWPCDVSTNFATSNLGCQERVISGLDWVFSLVEEAIILEDDCLPDSSFFPFCQELLERYRGDSRISSIAGTNLTQRYVNTKSSYYFSELGGIWGWATWRAEWQKYDRHLTDWPKLKNEKMLSEIFDHPKAVAYWTAIFDAVHINQAPTTWDYQWLYTRLKNNALTVVPRSNLIANIGFGCDATNTSVADARFTPPLTTMKFPLQHPSSFVPSRSIDVRLQGLFTTSLAHRIPRKLRRISTRLFKDRSLREIPAITNND
ncbi:hypothetical protein RBB77_05170 [Tunturibacter psychrotolerans]|uniref:Hemolytic protein HlpA-like protein n=1 Tax=Tunturiibacter psychrotolerans TaxID=3069686 RepID=A0AAU7ZTK7_9BACT